MTVEIQTRAFTDPLVLPDITLTAKDYEWDAIGGPDIARVEARGNSLELWNLRRWLRAPITIRNERGRKVWWGFIREVTLEIDHVSVGVSLDDMVNRVRVIYTTETDQSTSGRKLTSLVSVKRISERVRLQGAHGLPGILDGRRGRGAGAGNPGAPAVSTAGSPPRWWRRETGPRWIAPAGGGPWTGSSSRGAQVERHTRARHWRNTASATPRGARWLRSPSCCRSRQSSARSR